MLRAVCVVGQVREEPSLAGLSDKELTKRVMPFAQFRMKEALRSGKQVSTSALYHIPCPYCDVPIFNCVIRCTAYCTVNNSALFTRSEYVHALRSGKQVSPSAMPNYPLSTYMSSAAPSTAWIPVKHPSLEVIVFMKSWL